MKDLFPIFNLCFFVKLFIRLKQKYIIHAQDKKADLLEFLVKHFNNRPLLRHSPEVNKS